MAKNIILLSDGTGNGSATIFKTNVWRLFQTLDLRDPNSQIAYYDDGVGTSPFILFSLLGGIFGFGLKRNVIDIYSFCCRNYQPGDRIYCFGFSRGAFTIRIVAKLISYIGIVKYENSEAALASEAEAAYRLFQRNFGTEKRWWLPTLFDVFYWVTALWRRSHVARDRVQVDRIQFVGLWDTVDAYGGPIDEITRTIDYWVWPLSMPDRFMSAKVLRACHALALDEERDAFRPVIWDQRYVRVIENIPGQENTTWLRDINYHQQGETGSAPEIPPHNRADAAPIDRERISQVWFTGVHADVGGGYSRSGLSYVALDWMIDRAEVYGLKFLAEQRQLLVTPQVQPYGKLNDSRRGIAAYYRYRPRNIAEIYNAPVYKPSIRRDCLRAMALLTGRPDPESDILAELHPSMPRAVPPPPPPPTIHRSVFDRIFFGTDGYAPVVLPADYGLTNKEGELTHERYPEDQGYPRLKVQNDVWNWIWLRRVFYFLTVFVTLSIAMSPSFVIYLSDSGGITGRLVVPVVNAAGSVLPRFVRPWLDAFRDSPGLVFAVLFAMLGLHIGNTLRRTIHDAMRVAWHSPLSHKDPAGWHRAVYWLRRQGWYRASFFLLESSVVPTGIFLLLLVWLSLWAMFGSLNVVGNFCTDRQGIAQTAAFHTSDICYATGIRVVEGGIYQISMAVTTNWEKSQWIGGVIPANPEGLAISSWTQLISSWTQLMGVPFKRLIWSKRFAPVVRVGSTGIEEHIPVFKLEPREKNVWAAQFTAHSNGEVFVYVNDTSSFLPWLFRYFYSGNKGTADIVLKPADAAPK